MRLAIISFTRKGAILAEKLKGYFDKEEDCVQAWAREKFAVQYGLQIWEGDLESWTGDVFGRMHGIIYIGACGIAVRGIAPFIETKAKDPAVLCIDEEGKYIIPLLSGHIGGANELAGKVAGMLNGTAVITTATDINGCFAVDILAKKNGLFISDMKLAKEISAIVLEGRPIMFYSDFPISGVISSGIEPDVRKAGGELGISVSYREESIYKETLCLIPRVVSIGIGCKKGIDFFAIEKAILAELSREQISVHAIKNIASIDLKNNEAGIKEFADKYQISFHTYSCEELARAEGTFTGSKFVEEVTGIDNVCERSAVLASGGGKIIMPKTSRQGITLALAVQDWSVKFE